MDTSGERFAWFSPMLSKMTGGKIFRCGKRGAAGDIGMVYGPSYGVGCGGTTDAMLSCKYQIREGWFCLGGSGLSSTLLHIENGFTCQVVISVSLDLDYRLAAIYCLL